MFPTKVNNMAGFTSVMSKTRTVSLFNLNSKLHNIASLQTLQSGVLKHSSFFSTSPNPEYDVVVVGGGIVGMAAAKELAQRHKGLKIALVEKENKVAFHQSGHNSGVIHAGIYYTPGTLKAKLCVEGMSLAYKYCDEKKIPYKKNGKLIVATNDVEAKRLDVLYERAIKNNAADVKMIEKNDIQKIEPNCVGVRALHSPNTGIVDWAQVTEQYSEDFKCNGGIVYLNYEVTSFEESPGDMFPVIVKGKNKMEIKTKFVLTCGGLQSDKLAKLSGCSSEPCIIPVRGEYLLLKPEKSHLVCGNIYPVPDPKFPFLGVHFTPRMDGSVWLGPNAVLAFKREGYRWRDVNVAEFFETVTNPGFLKLAVKFMGFGAKEMLKSAVLDLQVKELQKFIPCITRADVVRGPAGVRAQALGPSGEFVDDFVFDVGSTQIGKRILHCRNAPSPGATSSLAIAKLVADKVQSQFNIT